jgi:hypothetical protein
VEQRRRGAEEQRRRGEIAGEMSRGEGAEQKQSGGAECDGPARASTDAAPHTARGCGLSACSAAAAATARPGPSHWLRLDNSLAVTVAHCDHRNGT